MTAVNAAIDRGVHFLVASQLPHGEFTTLASLDADLCEPCRWDSSPFTTTFVLPALALADPELARPAIERGIAFLLDEREAPGLWRYWTHRNPRHAFIPPDVDDTCCASWVLRRFGYDPGPNEASILANRDEQGRFRTWFVPERGVDAVVNANALLYLGERPDTAAACAFVLETMAAEPVGAASPFYTDGLSLCYMVSRAYRHGVSALAGAADAIAHRATLRLGDRGWVDNALTTALAACALLNVGRAPAALDAAIASLCEAQRTDGSWPRAALYVDTPGVGPPSWYGSDELTTSFSLEALAAYRDR